MAFFIMEYRVEGYGLQHALSLNAKAGRRVFSISSETLGTDDIELVKVAAALPEHTPQGYKLHSVVDRDAIASTEGKDHE